MSGDETMRAAIVGEDGRLALGRAPIARPARGEALVAVEACGICGSDLHAYRESSWAPGTIPGHEIAGRIESLEAVAPEVIERRRLAPGRRVVIEPLETCRRCSACDSGHDSICPELRIAGIHRPGGFADFIAIEAERLYPIPESVPPALATLCEPVAVALHALDVSRFVPGERVLVLGGGAIGLLCAMAARLGGASEVLVRARYLHQRHIAVDLLEVEAMDAALGIDESGLADRFDLVIESVGGTSDTLQEACETARPGGRIVILGLFSGSPRFDPFEALRKELTLHWSNCYGTDSAGVPDFARSVELIRRNVDRLDGLIRDLVGLDHIDTAFERAIDKRSGGGRVVVVA